ncbi:MAG: hypothetical protein ACLFUS_01415 [Candidatus Sumerlaeia bacterium]
MRKYHLVLLTSVLLLFLSACATPPPVSHGYLPNYDVLQSDSAYSPIYYYDPPNTQKLETHLVYLQKIKWLAESDISETSRENIQRVFDLRLKKWIFQVLPTTVILIEDEADMERYETEGNMGIFRIEPAITEVRPGISILRYIVGFGLGDAAMVVEVKAYHSSLEMNDVYQAYVYTHSPGKSWFGPNPRTFWLPYCLRSAADLSTRVIAAHFANRIEAPQSEWWTSVE